MFTRALIPFRTHRRRKIGGLAVALALIAAPLALLPSAASADSGSGLTGSPFNASDGVLDSTPAVSVTPDSGTGNLDNSYTQGAKENDLCPAVEFGSIPPSKADLSNLYVGTAKGSNGHTFLYLGWSRTDTNGTVTLDFELNQATQPLASCHNGVNPARTAGDVLVTYDFQGGQVDALLYRIWNGSEWGDPVDVLSSAEGSIDLSTLKFGEMVIDLEKAGIFTAGVCKNLASQLVKSRSSDSFQAEMKDFIGPGRTEVTNCGSLTVSKTVVGGAGESFSFTVDCGSVDLNGATAGDDLTFSLGNGGSRKIDDIPLGSSCSVTESDPGGSRWITTYTVAGGGSQSSLTASGVSIALGNKTVAFTNTRKVGDLVIDKLTTGGSGTFTFHVDCDGEAFDQDVTITDSGSQTIHNIPTGTHCTVTETADPLFTSTSTPPNGTVTIDTNGETVSFLNVRKTAGLTISKLTTGGSGTFTFDIDCDGSQFDKAVSITNSGTYTLTGIPTGTHCKVTEREDRLFTSTSLPADGEVTIDNDGETVAFTNTAKPNGISIDKKVNGVDTSEQDPLDVEVGSQLHYTVKITNSGQVPLSISDLSDSLNANLDSNCEPAVDTMLDPNESITCSYTMTAVNPGGASIIHNTASVEGTDVFERSAGPDSDGTFVHVLDPAIHLDKTGPASAHVGDTITYTLTVTNPGNTPLAITNWDDDVCDADPVLKTKQGADNLLDPSETWVYECSHTVVAGDPDRLVNTATVTGTDRLEAEVDSTDDATTTILRPAIAITKTGITSAHVGDAVVYTLLVTNPGNTPLASVTVSDPKCDGPAVGSTVDADGLLSPGEGWTYHCTHVATAADGASILNTAKAEGTDSLGQTVKSTANHSAAVLHPAISIVKTADPELVSVSGPVTYRYVVTNTGDTTLYDVVVTDDILGAIGTIGELAPGESVTLAKTVEVNASTPPRNIGTAVGTDVLGQSVSANDDAIITVVLAEVLAQPELPRTGAPLQAETRAALMMIEVGIVMTLAGRRRRAGRRAD